VPASEACLRRWDERTDISSCEQNAYVAQSYFNKLSLYFATYCMTPFVSSSFSLLYSLIHFLVSPLRMRQNTRRPCCGVFLLGGQRRLQCHIGWNIRHTWVGALRGISWHQQWFEVSTRFSLLFDSDIGDWVLQLKVQWWYCHMLHSILISSISLDLSDIDVFNGDWVLAQGCEFFHWCNNRV
jgi:hypothetical protein